MAISVYPEKCSGCMSCQLACSFFNTGKFNPLMSNIIINWVGDVDRRITLSDGCVECNMCVEYCNYEALEVKE